MKRKIAMLLVSATLAIALLGGGVYAYFSDSESANDNNFTAGTMDLTLNDGGAASISMANVKPGDSGLSMYTLRNVGTVNGNLQVSIANLQNLPGSNPEPEGPNNADLAQSIHVHFWMDDGDGIFNGAETYMYDGMLSGVTIPSTSSLLTAGSSTYLAMAWGIDYNSVGNEIQGDLVNFDLVFTLTQVSP